MSFRRVAARLVCDRDRILTFSITGMFMGVIRHLKYEGARHLILVPGGPRTTRTFRLQVEGMSDWLLSMGGTPKADAEAGVDAWRRPPGFP
jgi:BAAT / Acyl-CoA thioester hydrolase C terminal